MTHNDKRVQIQVSFETRERLKALGDMDDTYDTVITYLIERKPLKKNKR